MNLSEDAMILYLWMEIVILPCSNSSSGTRTLQRWLVVLRRWVQAKRRVSSLLIICTLFWLHWVPHICNSRRAKLSCLRLANGAGSIITSYDDAVIFKSLLLQCKHLVLVLAHWLSTLIIIIELLILWESATTSKLTGYRTKRCQINSVSVFRCSYIHLLIIFALLWFNSSISS